MAKRVFQVKIVKGFGTKILEGMKFEVISSLSKPSINELRAGFKSKYGFDLHLPNYNDYLDIE